MENGAGLCQAGSGAAGPVQSLRAGVNGYAHRGGGLRGERPDAVVWGAAEPAADGGGDGVATGPEKAGPGKDEVLDYLEG